MEIKNMSCQNQTSRGFLKRLHQEMAKWKNVAFPNQEFPHIMDLVVLDHVDEDLGQNPMIYCSSLQLDPESPLTKLLRANMPLPMLFGLKKSAIQGLDYPADRI